MAGPWELEPQFARKSRVSEQAQEASWRRRPLSKTGSYGGDLGGCAEPDSIPGRRVSVKHMCLSSNDGAENQDEFPFPHNPRLKACDGERPAAQNLLPQQDTSQM